MAITHTYDTAPGRNDSMTIQRAGMRYEEIERRYPLLIASMKEAAILSTTEAADCIRAIQERRGSGEAVSHFGGPIEVFKAALRCRKFAYRLRRSRRLLSPNNTTQTGPDGCFPALS